MRNHINIFIGSSKSKYSCTKLLWRQNTPVHIVS